MVQEIIIYVIVAASIVYVGYLFYSSIKKKKACDKCELMKTTKIQNPNL